MLIKNIDGNYFEQRMEYCGMKLYILFYDQDTGAREEWNTFYTPCEVFDSEEKRQERINQLSCELDENGDPMCYQFHCIETELNNV